MARCGPGRVHCHVCSWGKLTRTALRAGLAREPRVELPKTRLVELVAALTNFTSLHRSRIGRNLSSFPACGIEGRCAAGQALAVLDAWRGRGRLSAVGAAASRRRDRIGKKRGSESNTYVPTRSFIDSVWSRADRRSWCRGLRGRDPRAQSVLEDTKAKRVTDKRILKLIRGFLTAGVLIDGLDDLRHALPSPWRNINSCRLRPAQ
jgi:hypothetical protein